MLMRSVIRMKSRSYISILASGNFLRWSVLSLLIPGVGALFLEQSSCFAQEKADDVKDPTLIYSNDFEKAKPGRVPGDYFVLDGDFEIEANEGEGAGRSLKLLPSQLVEASIQFGSSIEGSGSVIVRGKAEKRGRSYPRFGVGLHGLKGFRVRITPAAKVLELVRDQEVILSVPFDWTSGIWYFVELSVVENNNSWTVTGRAWAESEDRPKDGQVDHISVEEKPFRGKASITGTPYAGLPIYFDDLEIRKLADEAEGEGK